MGCRNQGSKKSKKSTGGPRVRVPLSLSGWSTGPRGACPPAVLLHILRISSGSSLFSSSSSAIVMTGALSRHATPSRCQMALATLALLGPWSPGGPTRDGPEIGLSGTDLDPAGFHLPFPLDRRRSVCFLAFRWRRGGCRQARARRGQAGLPPVPPTSLRLSFDSQSPRSEPHTLSSARMTRSHHLCFASAHRIALGDRWTCEARPIAVGRR